MNIYVKGLAPDKEARDLADQELTNAKEKVFKDTGTGEESFHFHRDLREGAGRRYREREREVSVKSQGDERRGDGTTLVGRKPGMEKWG